MFNLFKNTKKREKQEYEEEYQYEYEMEDDSSFTNMPYTQNLNVDEMNITPLGNEIIPQNDSGINSKAIYDEILRNSNLNGRIITYDQAKKLESISLRDIDETVDLGNLKFLNNLREITIERCKSLLNTQALEVLEKLEVLSIKEFNGIDAIDFRSLNLLPNKIELNLENIENLSLINLSGNTKIETLYIKKSRINNSDGLKATQSLKSIFLDRVTTTDVSFLKDLKELESCYCWNIDCEDLSALKELKQIRILSIKNLNISSFEFLRGFKNLECLYISDTEVSDFSALNECENLKYVDIRKNEIDDISVISNLPNLKYVTFENNNIDDFSDFAKSGSIESISIADNPVSISMLEEQLDHAYAKLNMSFYKELIR